MSALNNQTPSSRPLPVGQNASGGVNSYTAPIFQPTYANLATIQTLINNLQGNLISLQNQLVQALDGVALPITATDTILAAAVATTWPSSLGSLPNYVTYNYYNYLLGLNSSAATLITNAYLAAAQNVGGNNAIDLLPIVRILIDEVSYIDDFIANNLSGGISDSSEQRTAELFQDLLTSANTQVQNAQNIFKNQSATLSTTETSQLSQGDAQNAQALFQVNLNKLNIQLNQDIHILNTNFAANAQVFYTQFLEPALQFRQNVSSQILPQYSGLIGAAINTSVAATNNDLHNTLLDQQKRLTFLANQVDLIMTDIINRDAYRNYIKQLSSIGSPTPSGTSGVMIQAQDSRAALSYFQTAAAGMIPDATPSFTADHLNLNNILDPQAHPQYLTIDNYHSSTPSWFKDINDTLDLSNYATSLGIQLADTSTIGISLLEKDPSSSILLMSQDGGGVYIANGQINVYSTATSTIGNGSTYLTLSNSGSSWINQAGQMEIYNQGGGALTVTTSGFSQFGFGSETVILGDIVSLNNNGATGGGSTYIASGQGSLSFFNAPPILKPTVTGSKGANAALTSLINALSNFGLINDSTT